MMQSRIAIAVLILCAAAQGQFLDSRNLAMGGTGVATSHYASAGFLNPALLTRFGTGDHFAFIAPSVSLQVADEDELLDSIDNFQDEIDRAQEAINNATITPAQRASLVDSLFQLSGKTASLRGGVGLSFALPSKQFAWAIVASSDVSAFVTPQIDPTDAVTILTTNDPNALESLRSEGRIIGIATTEIGFAAATEFDLGAATLSIGVTPKVQRVETFNYSININTFDNDDFDDSRYREDSTEFNIDAGAALAITPVGITVGLALRNLIEHEFESVTIAGSSFRGTVGPQAKLGAGWEVAGLTLAADIDLVEIERVRDSRFDSRFLNLGAEFDLFGWLQARAGYQTDLEDTVEDVFTAGLGFAPAGLVHIDLTGVYGEGHTYGAAFQLWFTF